MSNNKQISLDNINNRNNNNSNDYCKEKQVHTENNVEKLLKYFDKISNTKSK